jgi:glycosyltransferase involved in cell wall biosynthesis
MNNFAGAQVVERPECPRPERDLTIIIPAFRCERYLPAAIESVLHSPAASILISDDCSGPELLRVADFYGRKHANRVQVLTSNRRRGAAGNVNDAVQHVRTPFFGKLDGDDVLLPGHIESVFRVIASRPTLGLIAGHEQRIEATESLVFDPGQFRRPATHIRTEILTGADAFRFILAWRPNPCSSGAIYRTDAFRQIGGFDQSIDWGEDWEIWLRMAKDWEVAYCHAPSALYRIHEQSTTARTRGQHRLCFGYEAVYRRAAEVCADYPELAPHLRRNFLRLARLFLTTAVRQAPRSPKRAVICGAGSARALATALAMGRESTAARPTYQGSFESR